MKRNEFEKELDKIFLGKVRTPRQRKLDQVHSVGFLNGLDSFVDGYCKILVEKIDHELEQLKKYYNECTEEVIQSSMSRLLTITEIHNELAGTGKNIDTIDIDQKFHETFSES